MVKPRMSTLNKYIIFQCDTCKRQTELQIGGNRVDPIRCIITYKCRGKLSRIGESSSKKFLFTPPVQGLQDYIPRGTLINPAPILPSDPNVSLNTSQTSMLTMAILKRTVTTTGNHQYSVLAANGTEIILDTQPDSIPLAQNVKVLFNIFPISPSVLQSTTFMYLVSGQVNVISGADNSPDANTLRFSASNNISVYVNGILLANTAYVISIPNQSITFTPAIYELNNVVDVIVYNDYSANVAPSSIIGLEFDVLDPTVNPPPPYVSDLSFLNNCSWGNYYAADVPNVGVRYLMHCTNLTSLLKDISYGIDSIQVVIGAEITMDQFIAGTTYTISNVGTNSTAWAAVGVTVTPALGVIFTAIGSTLLGDGTATLTAPIAVKISEANLLLAHDPYEFADKELNAFLSGSSFSSNFALTFSQDQLTGIYKFTTLQSTLTQLLHPLIPSDEISSALLAAQSTEGAVTAPSSLTHKYIIGPT